jgi:hypothetical protein
VNLLAPATATPLQAVGCRFGSQQVAPRAPPLTLNLTTARLSCCCLLPCWTMHDDALQDPHPSISVHAAAWRPMVVAWWVSRKQIGGRRRRPAGTSRGGFIPRKRVCLPTASVVPCACLPTGGIRFRWYAATLQQYVFSVCML